MSLSGPQEISWENLDKTKFYTLGVGIFSGVTTCLFPLTVIKTRQIAGPVHHTGFKGVQSTVAEIWRNERIRGFYKGFGTVCVGAIPARAVYMSGLELGKSGFRNSLHQFGISDVAMNGTVNFLAGATASMCSQAVFVPIDVVSQRLMVLNNSPGSNAARMNGLSMAKLIISQEGVRGLWKGFFASIGTYVPNSAIWWGSYGFFQKLLWKQRDWIREQPKGPDPVQKRYVAVSDSLISKEEAKKLTAKDAPGNYSMNEIVAVQTCSALLSGVTAAFFTTPLDVVKTRMQLSVNEKGSKRVTALSTCQKIITEEGVHGLMRGFLPRAASVAMWGTCMVSAYEFLKRAAAFPTD